MVAVVAFDGAVLGDLAMPCEVFGRVRNPEGRSAYEVRICSLGREVRSEHVTLKAPWRLSSVRRGHGDRPGSTRLTGDCPKTCCERCAAQSIAGPAWVLDLLWRVRACPNRNAGWSQGDDALAGRSGTSLALPGD
jgi:hypothetical protein